MSIRGTYCRGRSPHQHPKKTFTTSSFGSERPLVESSWAWAVAQKALALLIRRSQPIGAEIKRDVRPYASPSAERRVREKLPLAIVLRRGLIMAVELSHVDESSTHASTTDRGRMVFVDVLRVALIVLVIAHHSAQAYGPTGGSWPVEDPANSDLLGPFFAVNAAFFMGLLFFLAGYFAPGSYDRKGPSRFVRDRWARIGVPLCSSFSW